MSRRIAEVVFYSDGYGWSYECKNADGRTVVLGHSSHESLSVAVEQAQLDTLWADGPKPLEYDDDARDDDADRREHAERVRRGDA